MAKAKTAPKSQPKSTPQPPKAKPIPKASKPKATPKAKKTKPIEIIHYDDSEIHSFQLMVDDEVEASELSLYEDSKGEDDWNANYWLNGISTNPDYQGQGFAETLIEAAIDYYGHIYISTASKEEHIEREKGERTNRAMNADVRKFIDRMVEKGIIQPQWLKNPFDPANNVF